MTLQQLKYVIEIADCGTLSKASERTYISQPSLSQALKELESEIGMQLFTRNNRGLVITVEGNEFLAYARQVVEQMSLIEDKYIYKQVKKKNFAVSTQHYSFAVKAFIQAVKHFDPQFYELAIKETKTYDVIDDVRYNRSEIGILYLNHFNRTIFSRLFKDFDLSFTPLGKCKIYAYMSGENPLAKQSKVTLDELQDYPCLAFEQGSNNSFFYAEEVLSTFEYKQLIRANDRATMLNLMMGLNAYTLCSGIISEDLNGDGYVAIELDSDERMEIGYIRKNGIPVSEIGSIYIEEIEKIFKNQL